MSSRHIVFPVLASLAFLGFLASKPALAQQPSTANTATPLSAESHLGRGYDALKEDRYEVAVSEFRAALQLDPKLTLRARFPLAVALFEMHKPDESRKEFETVRREVGDHPNILYYLGRLDLDSRNLDDAIRELNQAAEKPPFPDIGYYLGFAYFKRGDLSSAEKWLAQAEETNPHDARIPYQLGQVYRKQGHEDEAKKQFALSDDLRRQDDTESKLRSECAQKLEQGNRDEAHAVCDQLYDPNDADKLTALGTIYGQHGDFQAALKDFSRAAELSPQSPQMQYNLALVYYQLNQFEQAGAPLQTALQRWPDLFQLNALYGAVLVKLGDDTKAYDTLRRANQLNPQDMPTIELLYGVESRMAEARKAARQYSDAVRFLQEAAQLRPAEPAPHQALAEIYRLTGRFKEAESERVKAERLAKAISH